MCCNCEFCKNINWGKIFLAAVVFMIISFVMNMAISWLTMGFYMMPQYWPVWSKVMMPEAGPPPTSFYIWALIFDFITGLVLAKLYVHIRQTIGQSLWSKVICFTCILTGLSIVFFTFPLYLLINLPLTLILYWLGGSIVSYFIISIFFVKIMK
jgi:hypothetical protein